tara:strand:+ start:34266 stop:35639 length:1374 start_codon:yes stop_codon:yes gene_type:complete
MEKLSSQDAGFLRIESGHCPFHVAGLMILKLPEGASPQYLRSLARRCGQLNEVWPAFSKKLHHADNLNNAAWVDADDYCPSRHVYHYALPPPGRMDDLLQLVTRAHERPLDRSRPLWEMHVIEGLGNNRFALYCKVHHALVDGVGAMKMIQSLFSTSPQHKLDVKKDYPRIEKHATHPSLFRQLGKISKSLLNQGKALPELSRLLAHMGVDTLQGKEDAMRLPFTAPRSLFNQNLDSCRSISIADLPLGTIKKMARTSGGTINDVLLAICGGALRRYLREHGALPRQSLVAGMPVSLKSAGDTDGNRLTYIVSPFFTNESSDLKRLKRVIKVTREAKSELGKMSITASEDFYALVMAPTVLLTLTGNATRFRPAINAIFSNVPGSREKLYLDGAELESLYPLSIVTDGMGLNITVVSHANKLCFAIASCPTQQPGVDQLGKLLKASYHDLRQALKNE